VTCTANAEADASSKEDHRTYPGGEVPRPASDEDVVEVNDHTENPTEAENKKWKASQTAAYSRES
jgi:hypothetical protein